MPRQALADLRRLRAAGKPDEAIALCRSLLADHPGDANTWFVLGQLYQATNEPDRAIRCFDAARPGRDGDPAYHLARGATEIELRRFRQAAVSYETALSLDPCDPVAAFGLGVACIWTQEWGRAVQLFRLLTGVWNDNASVWLNLAIALYNVLSPHEPDAESAAGKVMSLHADGHPDAQKAALLLLNIYWDRRQYDKLIAFALEMLSKPLADGTRASVLTLLIRGETYLSKWESLDVHFEQATALVESTARGILVQDLLANPNADAGTLLRCAIRNCDEAAPGGRQPAGRAVGNARYPLRVGFVSSDLREHAVAVAFVRCFELLSARTSLTLYAYATARPKNPHDPLTARFRRAAGRFVDASALSTRCLAQRIRDDRIDVLVDLNGHTANHRIEVFSYRPAPVQVNYLGFPGTTGSGYHDWIVGDRFVTPAGEESCFTEKIWRLPNSYMPTDDTRVSTLAPSRAQAGLPEDKFVFACFNSNRKINADVFDAWCTILRAVPRALLWLRACPADAQENLTNQAQARWIGPERLVFAPWCTSATDHLARIALADLALDTWPYNMHVTCVDTLFAGVPVLTLKGRAFPGRVAESILNAAGLADLVAETRDDYIALAVQLATDADRRETLRQRVRSARSTAPLFDSAAMAHTLETALIAMYERETGVRLSNPE